MSDRIFSVCFIKMFRSGVFVCFIRIVLHTFPKTPNWVINVFFHSFDICARKVHYNYKNVNHLI